MVRVVRVPVPEEDPQEVLPQVLLVVAVVAAAAPEDEPDAARADKVILRPVGGADVARGFRHHVLVVVHSGEGDGGLGGVERRDLRRERKRGETSPTNGYWYR